MLAFVSRRLSSDPIVLVTAIRDGFSRSFGDTDTLRHRLSGLDDAAAERLLDTHAPGLSADLRRRFLREAAGNPLALVELPRGERAADVGDAPWLPLTERLERAFSSRLSELSNAARTLFFVAAENDGTSLHEILGASEVLLGERREESTAGNLLLRCMSPELAQGVRALGQRGHDRNSRVLRTKPGQAEARWERQFVIDAVEKGTFSTASTQCDPMQS